MDPDVKKPKSKMSDDARPAAEQPREWAPEIEEIEQRRAIAEQLGGPDAIARQHSLGKLTVRERIARLVDDGSFREFGALTGKVSYGPDGSRQSFIPSNSVIGVGRIDKRKVCISADDFTIRGGSSESTNSDKWIYIERFALETKAPLVRLVDTAGGSVKLLDQQQATKIPGYNNWPVVPLLDTVPVVGVALGSCAGLGAFKVMASHFSIMVRDTSQVFAAGPPVVKQAFGVDIDKNSLGGYEVHSRHSGLVDNEADRRRRRNPPGAAFPQLSAPQYLDGTAAYPLRRRSETARKPGSTMQSRAIGASPSIRGRSSTRSSIATRFLRSGAITASRSSPGSRV